MADLRPVPNEFYNEAAQVVTSERKRSGDNSAIQADIEKVIRSYVNAGQTKRIIDYTATLNSDAKDAIVLFVQSVTQSLYGFVPVYAKVLTNLDIIETQGLYGRINPIIVYPRRYQEEWEKSIAESHGTSEGGPADESFGAALERVFGGIGRTIKSTFDGLGIPILPIIILVIALVLLPYLRGR